MLIINVVGVAIVGLEKLGGFGIVEAVEQLNSYEGCRVGRWDGM